MMLPRMLCCDRDAWNKLGDMSAQEAMVNYVEELKKVDFVTSVNFVDN